MLLIAYLIRLEFYLEWTVYIEEKISETPMSELDLKSGALEYDCLLYNQISN